MFQLFLWSKLMLVSTSLLCVFLPLGVWQKELFKFDTRLKGISLFLCDLSTIR